MHDLATIIALNERATERCATCQRARITLEARKEYLHPYTIPGKDTILLCSSCTVGE